MFLILIVLKLNCFTFFILEIKVPFVVDYSNHAPVIVVISRVNIYIRGSHIPSNGSQCAIQVTVVYCTVEGTLIRPASTHVTCDKKYM